MHPRAVLNPKSRGPAETSAPTPPPPEFERRLDHVESKLDAIMAFIQSKILN